jgi:hypothetical protein
MTHPLRTGVEDQIALFRAYNDDDTPKKDLTSATSGLTLSVFRPGLAQISISSLTDKAADDTAHADGAIRRIGGNLYSVDLPDAATATYCPSISVRGTYTGGEIEPIVHPMAGYNPSLIAVGANTATPLDAMQTQAAAAAAIEESDLVTTAMITGGNVKPSVRTIDDLTPIRFVWPTPNETITVERSINASNFTAASGTVSFFRTEGNEHWYKLSYDSADREIGVVRYKLTDGTITRYTTLQVESNSASAAIIAADVATKTKQDEIIGMINAGELGQDIKAI